MAVEQVNEYTAIYSDVVNLGETTDTQRLGYHQVSLTEIGTTTVPQIAAGSVFENNGSLYKVTSNTSIGGSPSSGRYYIYFDVSALAFIFSNSLGTWSDSKQGFYDSNDRYLLWEVYKTGSLYYEKRRLYPNNDGGLRVLDFLSVTRRGYGADVANRSAVTNTLTAEPNTVSASVDLIAGQWYEILLTGSFVLTPPPVTVEYAYFNIAQSSGTATTHISVINPNESLTNGATFEPVVTINTGSGVASTQRVSFKSLVYCSATGTAVFVMQWARNTGTLTSSTREIFVTGVGYIG